MLRRFGLDVLPTDGFYHCTVDESVEPDRPITLTERGDTVTENALLAAALSPGVTVLRNASPNYMVQDLCVFLTHLGVEIDGIGTTTLRVHGVDDHQRRRRVRAVGGPDRGDEPAHRGDRHPVGD